MIINKIYLDFLSRRNFYFLKKTTNFFLKFNIEKTFSKNNIHISRYNKLWNYHYYPYNHNFIKISKRFLQSNFNPEETENKKKEAENKEKATENEIKEWILNDLKYKNDIFSEVFKKKNEREYEMKFIARK